MRKIIQFYITKGDGYYTAESVDLSVVTQGKTLDELTSNIKEAVSLHLEGENLVDLGLEKEPSVLINWELENNKVYA